MLNGKSIELKKKQEKDEYLGVICLWFRHE